MWKSLKFSFNAVTFKKSLIYLSQFRNKVLNATEYRGNIFVAYGAIICLVWRSRWGYRQPSNGLTIYRQPSKMQVKIIRQKVSKCFKSLKFRIIGLYQRRKYWYSVKHFFENFVLSSISSTIFLLTQKSCFSKKENITEQGCPWLSRQGAKRPVAKAFI